MPLPLHGAIVTVLAEPAQASSLGCAGHVTAAVAAAGRAARMPTVSTVSRRVLIMVREPTVLSVAASAALWWMRSRAAHESHENAGEEPLPPVCVRRPPLEVAPRLGA